MVNEIDRELHRNVEVSKILSISYFLQLLSTLYESRESLFSETISTESRIKHLIDRISDRVSENFSIEELSSMSSTSTRNFRRESLNH